MCLFTLTYPAIQGLVDQLKEVIPAMQMSISDLTEEVNISSTMVDGFSVQSSTTVQCQSAGRQSGLKSIDLDPNY